MRYSFYLLKTLYDVGSKRVIGRLLNDIKKIILLSKKILSDQGILFMENGIDQTDKISCLLQANDFTDISVHIDYNGHGRFTSSYKK